MMSRSYGVPRSAAVKWPYLLPPATQGDAIQKTTKQVDLESSIRVHSFETDIKIGIGSVRGGRLMWMVAVRTVLALPLCLPSVKLVSQESELPCNMIGENTAAVQCNLMDNVMRCGAM